MGAKDRIPTKPIKDSMPLHPKIDKVKGSICITYR